MPLHTEQEALRAWHGDCFDLAVGRDGFRAQRRRKFVDTLAVERIHPEHPVMDDAREKSAGLDRHLMRGTVLHVERRVGVLAMVTAAGDLLDVLVERSTKRNIQLLEAAADAERR